MEHEMPFEEIYVGIVRENKSPDVVRAKPGEFAVFHATEGHSDGWVGVKRPFLVGYLAGALQGKLRSHISLRNGINERGRDGWFPEVSYDSISTTKLLKILEDANLDRKYSPADFRKVS
jgi:hypothetical protein